ncbi:SpoVG family protein [Eisenbergiella sp.]
MPTVDIRITSMYPPGGKGGTRAYASATIDGCFAVRGIKIVEGGRTGLFVSMPSRKTQDGYKEMCFPVTAEFREQLCRAVLDAYQQAITQAQAAPEQQAAPAEGIPQAGQQMGSM